MSSDYDKEIFGRKKPKFILFSKYIKNLSPDKRKECFRHYHHKSFSEWSTLTPDYQDMLLKIAYYNRQLFLEYALEETILGKLRFPLEGKKEMIKLIYLNEKKEPQKEINERHFSFCCLLTFDLNGKDSVEALRTFIRKEPIFRDKINLIVEYINDKQEEEGKKKTSP